MAEQTLVVGGGIQGATAALALAERGLPATILEAGPELLTRASRRNEGKVHLGFVYALDSSPDTVAQMVEGALSLAPLLERWCGEIDWAAMRSQGFAYVVMPDSLASADALADHYGRVSAQIESLAAELGADYCGTDPLAPVQRGEGPPPGFDTSADLTWFATPEISLDPRVLSAVLERAVREHPLIQTHTDHRVVDVARTESGFTLICDTPTGLSDFHAEQVLNCAWEGRAALDEMAGLEPEQLLYRIKHQVIACPADSDGEATTALAPLTMVQGPFGDLVPWQGGEVYVSWYPAARTFIGSEPSASDAPDPAVAEASLQAIQRLVPSLAGYEVSDHAPAWILAPDLAHASSDISEGTSPLHERSRMEVVDRDGWWSLRSHKLTTAPLVSDRCAEQVTGAAAGQRRSVT